MLQIGTPLAGSELNRLKDFLRSGGLRYDPSIGYTVNVLEPDRRIAATGSLAGNVLKCILVAPERRGDGLTGQVLTALTMEAARRGLQHLMLFTKPKNATLFGGLGFYEVARTGDVLLMENQRQGVRRFVQALPQPRPGARVGAIVCNCDPFTLGHQYLAAWAARQCDELYLFVLAENAGMFSPPQRMEMVRRGTAALPNVHVVSGGPYLITRATFPDYFLKDEQRAQRSELHCMLDLKIFYTCFAKPLGISVRFVGTEPYCSVTAAYNKRMQAYLPSLGVHVEELPRLERGGAAVSASHVRRLLSEGRRTEAAALLPESTRALLQLPDPAPIQPTRRIHP